jgi:hypothetical protein
MEGLTDLTNATPEEWDAAITAELESAGIELNKFREPDSPNFWVKHTLNGKLGDWSFSRELASYSFWGDVPLATAEVITADPACFEGCVPRQWLPSWGEQPDPREVHARFAESIAWIDRDGCFRVQDTGQSAAMKKVLQRDTSRKLLFVAEPSADGKPFIQNYTFFTLEALKNFVEIAKRHRVDFKYTH